MVSTDQILTYLKENKNRFRKDYHIVKLGIFGSIARGEQDNNSDIDLLVEFEPNTDNLYEVKSRLKNELQDCFHISVDICSINILNRSF